MKLRRAMIAVVGSALLVTFARVTAASTAEVKVFTARAGATVLEKLGPKFESMPGHKLNVMYDADFGLILRRIAANEPFDVMIRGTEGIDSMIKDGTIAAETRTNLLHSGMGVEVRAGAPKPDISSVEAFKRALLNAKSIGHFRINRVQELIERLGLADAIRSKVTTPNTDIVSELVAKGELELGIVVTTQILTTPGVELVGPLPPEIQYDFPFAAGVSTNSKAPGAALDLIKFLTGPIAIPVIKSQGMEPG
jgi:molybdate transport system substrate-binding protein